MLAKSTCAYIYFQCDTPTKFRSLSGRTDILRLKCTKAFRFYRETFTSVFRRREVCALGQTEHCFPKNENDNEKFGRQNDFECASHKTPLARHAHRKWSELHDDAMHLVRAESRRNVFRLLLKLARETNLPTAEWKNIVLQL